MYLWMYLSMYSLISLFIYLFISLFVYSIIYFIIHLFIHLWIHSFIYLFVGGMQTEGLSDMPRFKNDTTYIVPNIGFEVKSFLREESKKSYEEESDEELRLKSKFLSVKA